MLSPDFAALLVLVDASGKNGLAQASALAGSPARRDITPEAGDVFHVLVTSGRPGKLDGLDADSHDLLDHAAVHEREPFAPA
jgi:hypothetical protein